ncbi:MAG: ribonuclease H-like domain-containing protein [Treponema sp.]|nr:ribonuclease H-like domain-containing protein [Treponema sp.]
MANLRDRLKIIQEQKKNEVNNREALQAPDYSTLTDKGWIVCGFQVLKRDVFTDSPFKSKTALPPALPIIVSDLAGRKLPEHSGFLFFDLETTGLSGGAGTIAFLAAFGRIVKRGSVKKLRITQYLLLDYPGECDFLDVVLKEFIEGSVIVTYNGKCFDSQILKTRCLMNRIPPPVYLHADLLHPARRLWKNVIQDCSQASIETRILGLDRSGDIPGALAPEIWFEFIKTGSTDRLTGICDHNASDISGLASILAAMVSVAEDPFGAKYDYDAGRLALYWRTFCRRHEYDDLQKTSDKLLRYTAQKKIQSLPKIKAALFRALAIDCERKQKDAALALEYVKKGLQLTDAGEVWQNDFERRKERLEKKLAVKNTVAS